MDSLETINHLKIHNYRKIFSIFSEQLLLSEFGMLTQHRNWNFKKYSVFNIKVPYLWCLKAEINNINMFHSLNNLKLRSNLNSGY